MEGTTRMSQEISRHTLPLTLMVRQPQVWVAQRQHKQGLPSAGTGAAASTGDRCFTCWELLRRRSQGEQTNQKLSFLGKWSLTDGSQGEQTEQGANYPWILAFSLIFHNVVVLLTSLSAAICTRTIVFDVTWCKKQPSSSFISTRTCGLRTFCTTPGMHSGA